MSFRNKLIFHNVAPAILANACVFLFSVVDRIFVGQGAGMEALGAVNLALLRECSRCLVRLTGQDRKKI